MGGAGGIGEEWGIDGIIKKGKFIHSVGENIKFLQVGT